MWLLDTNAWIAFLEREPNPVKNRIAALPESAILLCDVVKAEYDLWQARQKTQLSITPIKVPHAA
jgi:predicted nucleic acid-binding protein